MLVLVFVPVVLLSLILLYKSGVVTSAKMELQNGADAAAYSASTLEARALNFCAYTNRAMAANEVGIGQMVGMLSWVDELKSAPEFSSLYAEIPVAGEIIMGLQDGMGAAGEVMSGILEAIAPIYIKVISGTNEVYSIIQQVYYGATIALVTRTLFQNLNDNIPGTNFSENIFTELQEDVAAERKGAKLSPVGLVALAGHAASYMTTFTRRYSAKNSKDRWGMGRLAATIRTGRDGFSSGVKCGRHNSQRDTPECENRDWGLSLSLEFLLAKLTAGFNSVGGTELRFKKDKETASYRAIWSAVDTAVLEGKIRLGTKKHHKTIELGLPLSAGESQATGGAVMLYPSDMPSSLGKLDFMPDEIGGEKVSDHAYGGAAGKNRHLTWYMGVAEIEGKSVEGASYGGLRSYRDIPVGAKKSDPGLLPFKSPFFFVGLIENIDDVEGSPLFSRSLSLYPGKSFAKKIAVIAKSEVFFSRPDNPGYFQREDGKHEFPNLFSPFWQARLVDTTEIDRLLALALQQDIIWLKGYTPSRHFSYQEAIKDLEKLLESFL
jgi:hypothetical protein